MTSQEIRGALSRMNVTQADMARYLDVDIRTMRRWCANPQPHPIPTAVVHLLVLLEFVHDALKRPLFVPAKPKDDPASGPGGR